MSLNAAEIYVTGTVQGVGFRYFSLTQAIKLKLNGWVKNLKDGAVLVHAEGSKEAIDTYCEILKKGPAHSFVAQVDIKWLSYSGNYDSFEITY